MRYKKLLVALYLVSIVAYGTWWANMAFWIGVLLFALRKDRGALLAAESAVLLAYPVLGMWIWGIPFMKLTYGFFVWFGSMLLLAVAARYRLYFERRKGIGLTSPA
jgi:hypothetical protein